MAAGDERLVCFDLGGVLVEIHHDWRSALQSTGLGEHRVRMDGALLASIIDAARRYESGRVTCEGFFGEVVGLTGLPEQAARDGWNAILRCPFADAPALLTDLHSVGVRTACLSNTNAEHWRVMHDAASHCPLPMGLFRDTFASHLLGFAKPDADAYLAVEGMTGISPERIIFFDDREENIAAAESRGWHAVRITEDNPPAQARRVLVGLGLL